MRHERISTRFLHDLAARIEEIQPEEFSPSAPLPAHDDVYVGEATDYQWALITLGAHLRAEHEKVHEETGLPFGANRDLPYEHRLLHLSQGIVQQLLSEDLTQLYSGPVGIIGFTMDERGKLYLRMRQPPVPWYVRIWRWFF